MLLNCFFNKRMPEQKTLYGQQKMWQPNLGKDRTLPPIKDADKQIKDGIRIKSSTCAPSASKFGELSNRIRSAKGRQTYGEGECNK